MALFDFRKSVPAAESPEPPPLTFGATGNMIPMEDLLRLVVDENASDLHLTVGAPPAVRINGRVIKLDVRPLVAEDTESMARAIAGEGNMEKVNEEGSVDFGFSFRDASRFRVSVFRQRGTIGVALRRIPNVILSLEQIGLPQSVRQLLNAPRGLILVTGPTGSGKSTTLASMIDVINSTTEGHIMTIEDPIEYYHTHKRGVVNQREVGTDVPTFGEGLRRALRQDPDVILVGEMRDLTTMETAITASETGHLVFSTLHTTGAARTVDRIIDSFPSEQQEQIRIQLSVNLRAVISQILLPKVDGRGRVAAFEIMINTPSIAALIRDNKTFRITTDLQTGAKFGMQTLEASLVNLYLEGIIPYEEVINKAQDPEQAIQLVAGQKPKRR